MLFCPFYKEIFRKERKNYYLEALLHEIRQKDISGKPSWIYLGGGTPNVLSIEDLKKIIITLQEKVKLTEIGIEVLPELINTDYISDLKSIGFKRISFGIQSLHENILKNNNRIYSNPDKIYELVEAAKKMISGST
ncbi:MAG: radical SAM protein [Saprospiraceae bacterium]|nr:radical SAM protein [Saprospiraceae bacterium]